MFDFNSVQESLTNSKNILILISANSSVDSVAAALALYLSLEQQRKNVNIGCPTAMTVAFNRLVGVNKISNKIGSRNLVVSFDYIKDSIEKVSYNIEDNKFNLVVEPKPNFPPLDPEKVSYSHSGASADIIFVIGATKLEDLEKFYFEEKNLFFDKLTVNIDNKASNTHFGKINFHHPQTASCSEIVAGLIQSLSLPIDQDIATNLFTGIKANTANFQAINVNETTFEAAAWCLKQGARRDQLTGIVPPAIRFSQPTSLPTMPFNQPHIQQNSQIENKEAKPPPDWFKPKIYKSSKQLI